MKLNKTTKIGFAGTAGCLGVLGLLAVAMLCPVRSEGASAADCTADSTDPDCLISTASTRVATNVASVISIGLDPEVDIDVTPTADGTFSSSTASMTVATNSSSGYKIYMKTADGTQNLNGTGTNASKIGAVTSGKTPSGFAKNTWGYNLSKAGVTIGDNTAYQPVPATSTSSVGSGTNTTATSDQYQLTFGAKVSSDLQTDTYSNSVTVSAVANPAQITTLNQLTYMQDMNSGICDKSPVGMEKQLTDTRDGKRYWVAKMKDGNCWMNQNLDLDIKADKGLSSADTDITANWNSSSTYPPKTTETAVPAQESSPSQTDTRSWDLGMWVLATPTETTSCGDVTDIASCQNVGFVDVSGSDWKPTFNAQQGVYTGPGNYAGKTTYIAVDYANKTYDPHYLIGNYYQWNTATAGTGGTITSADAAGSVCPKNWKLPTSGDSVSSLKDDSFASLLVKYGVASSLTGSADGVNYNIAEAPLYFVRSGGIGLSQTHPFNYAGQTTYVWSAMASSSRNSAHYFNFNGSNNVRPSHYDARYGGVSLRCLAS